MTWRDFQTVFDSPLRTVTARGQLLFATSICLSSATLAQGPSPVPSIFDTVSTPADSIHRLSLFVLTITGLIFIVVFSLLVYAVGKFRRRSAEDNQEPAQVYGSNQMELAWTVIPVLIVLVLFFATARVIQSVQDAVPPPCSPGHRDRSPVLVGIPLSGVGNRHRERTPHSRKRSAASQAHLRQTSLRRYRPQFLGSTTRWKNRSHSQSHQFHVD